MKRLAAVFICLSFLPVLTACKPRSTVCAPGSVTYFPTGEIPAASDASLLSAAPTSVRINGKNIQVDRVIHGSICNDTWSGTIYVACDISVAEWKDDPLFFSSCDLKIEPGTVVYVAEHNNSAYYNGCSCHVAIEGEGTPAP